MIFWVDFETASECDLPENNMVKAIDDRYSVTSDGRVFDHKRSRWLKISRTKSGHCTVKLRRKTNYVHTLVLRAFAPPPNILGRVECRHLNGVASDNRIENLRWGTVKENRADRRVLHETGAFSFKEAQSIKRSLKIGKSVCDLARKYDVDRHTISNIKSGKTYVHILV